MYARIDSRSRALSAAGALAVQAALALLLIQGLGLRLAPVETRALQVLDFPIEPPPPEIEPEKKAKRAPKEEGKASPPNIVSRATEVAAPPPILPTPPVMPAAPTPAQGSDASSGAAPVAGPGTGAGGVGDGNGSGDSGNGSGGGGGTDFRLIEGDLYDDDYPEWAQDAGISGTVYFRVTIGVNGRVSDCRVTRSIGNARLDDLTCRLVKKRFRFVPSRDAQGHPYVDTMLGEQTWVNQDRPGT